MTIVSPTASASTEESSPEHQDDVIKQAISILEKRMFKRGPYLKAPQDARDYLRLRLAGEAQEVFSALFLDSSYKVMAYETLFYGTIDSVAVYPRRILQRALEHNCAAIIVAHNHPSGETSPSGKDKEVTKALNDLLPRLDVRLLDHFIIGEGEPYSFAEAGLIPLVFVG
ncbi:DNA repair protein RadC [Pseudomonas sp. ICMP22404]|uniref:RadC family protein n=1 Tax=Pseudomonas TaxID=286 RepID=UPI0006D8A18E|nr:MULTISPECIES: DNA repair protein RadC [Pseudomonas]MCI0997842.1 DNA repair protein RadC [Pseudomonas corrugata]NUT69387.1 DNA repair protein RadC [Pseudomonas corrugata]TNF83795.1 DNA repair protein RadC [Pseudomonas sp. ICMP22404]